MVPEEGEVPAHGLRVSRCNALQLQMVDCRDQPQLVTYQSFGCIRWEATDG